MNLAGQQVAVVGLGQTGMSLVRWLSARGAVVRVADSRENPPNADVLRNEFPAVITAYGAFEKKFFNGADMLALSPGVSRKEPVLSELAAEGMTLAGDVELFARTLAEQPSRPACIAITGSNGKSTVTLMVEHLCRCAGVNALAAGNIGLPVLEALERDAAVYVLELSSFQLETTRSLQPVAATVLNISEDHMDRYVDLDDYAAAKARIFAGGGVQVLNREDARVMAMRVDAASRVTFGTDAPPTAQDFGIVQGWLVRGDERLMPVAELPVAGLHNAANALAALALVSAQGLPMAQLVEGLRTFRGLPHRVERVAEIDGVVYYDDSKGTNVGATEAALKGMPGRVVLIAGGDGKGQDFTPLHAAVKSKASTVILIGRDGGKIGAALAGSGVPSLAAASLEDAVRMARAAAKPGESVLLSPACASFDMFRNYEHRAEVFIAAVRALAEETREAVHV
jgi:UDP-N-acetylmuramoylalanine--D-glutamate ligase